MFDGFWSGLLGGLFGTVIAQWLSRFKYWVVFLATSLVIFFGILARVAIEKGLEFASTIALKRMLEFNSLLAIAGMGLLVVFMVFVCSLNAPKDQEKEVEDKTKP